MDGPEGQPPALLADAAWNGTLAGARNLGAHGVNVTVACDRWLAPARWSRYVARAVRCPSTKDAARFHAWLLRFGAAHPGYVLYPTSDEVAWLIAAHQDTLARWFHLYAPPIDSLRRLLDKARLAEDAQAVGLDVPETIVPRQESEVERCGRELAFPLYVKPRSQLFGRGMGKGVRIDKAAALLPAWRAQRCAARLDADVLDRVPDLHLPMLQRFVPHNERIYTVDGFVDETGEIYTTLACVKMLQRPRGAGPGIIFEEAEIDPTVDGGLRRLFQANGYCGVFDAEFIECGSRKLLIDVNPRFYSHMAFETERGLHLPWLAYLAATRNKKGLKAEIEKAKGAQVRRRAYVHRLPTALLLITQRLARAMSNEEQRRWRRRILENCALATDPVRTIDDPAPGLAEIAMEALDFMRHPRAYLRNLSGAPNSPPADGQVVPPAGLLADKAEP
jgi:predicted ATP-grasp superfamily ATP-dependent carboligase